MFRQHGERYRKERKPLPEQRKVMRDVESCRTSALGGHVSQCNTCGHEEVAYNSCRNRHCPKCQALVKARWVAARTAEVLPVGYYHVVFTVPHLLNPLILTNKRELLGLLFRAISATLLEFGERHLHGTLGGTMILHTWDQTLRDHFHVHCVVAAGALVGDGAWRHARRNFLFSVRALAKVFRGKYLAGLEAHRKALTLDGRCASLQSEQGWRRFMRELQGKRWVVFSKAPFQHPKHLLEYLGRYTHRVAISNDRIVDISTEQVSFAYRDRKSGNKRASMSLSADEFIRRYLLHTLPKGLQRIRHFGFLANRAKAKQLSACHRALTGVTPTRRELDTRSAAEVMHEVTGRDIHACPHCETGRLLVTFEISPLRILPRAPP